jgi:hypothetical protein
VEIGLIFVWQIRILDLHLSNHYVLLSEIIIVLQIRILDLRLSDHYVLLSVICFAD